MLNIVIVALLCYYCTHVCTKCGIVGNNGCFFFLFFFFIFMKDAQLIGAQTALFNMLLQVNFDIAQPTLTCCE